MTSYVGPDIVQWRSDVAAACDTLFHWGLYNVHALNPLPSNRQRIRIVEHDNRRPPVVRHASRLDRKALVFQAASH
jgi:hypothetical protein